MSVRGKAEYQVYLSLGSNIQPEINLPKAVRKLSEKLQILDCSTAWRNAAVGSRGPDFLNAVVLVHTNKSPDSLKRDVLEKIEVEMGRVRSEDKHAPRTIDIDIIVVNGKIFDHQIWTQAHLAVPLAEIYKDQLLSDTGKTLHDISSELKQTNKMKPLPEILLKR